jgi:uncharacterized protein with PQ loop repeat
VRLPDILGWVGGALLVACAFPQARKVWKEGHARGMSGSFLWMWIAGSALTLAYLIMAQPDATPVIAARVVNFAPLLIMAYFLHRPR